MLERHKEVPAVPSWAVFDSQYIRDYMLAGTMPGSKKPQEWYDQGYLKKARHNRRVGGANGSRLGSVEGNGRTILTVS